RTTPSWRPWSWLRGSAPACAPHCQSISIRCSAAGSSTGFWPPPARAARAGSSSSSRPRRTPPSRGSRSRCRRGRSERETPSPQRAIRELNSSIYVFEAASLWPALRALEPANVQGELYLTDTIEHIVAVGGLAAAYRCPDPIAPLGINTRAELAMAAAALRDR